MLVSSLIISGCVTAPPKVTPTPTGTPMPTLTPTPTPGYSVEVLSAPAAAAAGKSFEVSWRVNSPVQKNIPHTAIHYGPDSKSEPLTLTSYPSLTPVQNGTIPADFSTNITISRTGIIYFRAHAIIDGTNYWSDEKMIAVYIPSNVTPSVTPTIKVTSPGIVNGEANFTIQWEVSGGAPGDISQTAIYWGYNSGSANISDYPRATNLQTGKTPMGFSVELKAPATGPIYFRAHAIVDGVNVYSPEYQITINPRYTGGGY